MGQCFAALEIEDIKENDTHALDDIQMLSNDCTELLTNNADKDSITNALKNKFPRKETKRENARVVRVLKD